MKSKYTLIMLLLIPLSSITAQQPVIVSEDSLQIGSSVLPGLSVTIPEAEYDVVLKAWTRELESGTRSKVQTQNSEMQILGGKVKAISKDAINIFSKLEKFDSMLMLYASFETSKDLYITSAAGEAEFSKARDFMKEFAKNQYIDVAKAQSDLEEKKLRDLEKELSSLQNEKSRMEKSIESNRSSIVSEKENIALMNNELNIVDAALRGQDSLLASMEAGPAQKAKDKEIKEFDKRKKKALNSIESSEKKIQRSNDEIDKAINSIPQNERIQEKVMEQIAQQQAIYQEYADKLKRIRAY